MSRLHRDASEGLERASRESKRRREEAKTSLPLSITSEKLEVSLKRELSRQEESIRETHFLHESTNAVISHRNKHLKHILRKHSSVLDTAKAVDLLEKYEESNLCMDEIFQAEFMILKFRNYILKSRVDDLLNLRRNLLDEAEFISQRLPAEWKMTDEENRRIPTWNDAVKFLYQQATHRDLTFDYLKVLSLGLDKDTRIPLSADALIT